MTDRIVYLNSALFYYKEGTGAKAMVLFHGFGQDHWAFESWNEALRKEYTLYAFDLFFHGKSYWANPHALTIVDWQKIFHLFLEREEIGNFEMAGFSLGAKFAFATLEQFPDRVDKIIALAPDGIIPSFWYRLATSTALMRSFFRGLILRPAPLEGILRFLRFSHLANSGLLRLAGIQMGTKEKRQRVYSSWVYFRHLKFDQRALHRLLNSKNIPVVFILAKSDNITPTARIERFAKTLNNHQIQIIDAEHAALIAKGITSI